MSRRTVNVKIKYLDILPMIRFAIRKTEQALFQDGIDPVPKRQGKTQALLLVGDAAKPSSPQW